jgi:hypothetical protein
MLDQLKELLGMEVEAENVELAQMKLENGTVLEAESFEAGGEVFIVTEDEKVAVPVGEYELEDGKVLVVTEEGVIAEIKEGVTEEEEAAEEEVEAEEEEKVEAEYATKEELAEIKSMVEEIKAMITKEEMNADELGNVVTEELAAQEKTELSEEPVQKVSHSPEASVEKKMNLFSQKRAFSTIDRVFNNLNK